MQNGFRLVHDEAVALVVLLLNISWITLAWMLAVHVHHGMIELPRCTWEVLRQSLTHKHALGAVSRRTPGINMYTAGIERRICGFGGPEFAAGGGNRKP